MFDEIGSEKINTSKDKLSSPPVLGSGATPARQSLPRETGLPGKTEDIFAEVESGVKPEVFKPKISASSTPDNLISEKRLSFFGENKKFLVIGLIIISLVLVFGGGYFVIKKFFPVNITENSLKENSKVQLEKKGEKTASPPAPTENLGEKQGEQVASPPAASEPLDSDQDGLTDEEEKSLGTNPHLADSDGDGLFDREEVKVYGTDPFNPDTDGDGYLDGEEVKNGYNPKGSGRLYEIK